MMKKLLAVALVLCLLVPCAVAEAPVDVKSMSDAELKSLYISVKEELMERKLWDTSILPAGVYQAGKGLPEGTYECIAKSDTRVVIYKNMEKYYSGTNIGYFYPEEGQSFTLTLYDEIVYFVNSECIVRPFTGLDW
jgi:hypothetical protein